MTDFNSTAQHTMDFDAAKERLKGIIYETTLIGSKIFSKECGNNVYIKPENLQATGAFKIRGAYNKISKLSLEERNKGLIASSAGNHAQGVALAAHKLGVHATIVMPKSTPLIKIEATKKYGAKVILHGDCYDEAYQKAMALKKENGYIFVHPFNDADVIEGQGTIGLEIMDELDAVDYVLVPIGGGGLISGIAKAIKERKPEVKIIGVEPEGAMAMKKSLDKNTIICLDDVHTIADGVAVKKPGDMTFAMIQEYVDDIITVSDFEIMEACLLLLEKHKLVGENAGVLSLAALKKLKIKDKHVVSVVSGGNIDVLTMSAMINKGLCYRGRILCFSVDLTDKPGELLKISEILAGIHANVIKLDHNQLKEVDRFMEVELEITVETNGHEHIEAILSVLKDKGYDVKVK
ncbi:threonine ammonia-lyase [Vallitalea pronyensis]|uniref:L-threonine dehydratase catabolic TdcB n=1 Tax=Vallitalea pronyensis TaxID=1348613 RepID=A0A8J8MPW2_9FIRM|nr:threonine ammonia-lyase [Vallitalea pronyensis]QUI25429.1 threonine ammonia-lyase [Vallitalea pronyensis]